MASFGADRPDGTMFAGGHTATNTPDLFRTLKLTVAGPGQYWGGGPPGKPFGCCWLRIPAAVSFFRDGRTEWQKNILLIDVFAIYVGRGWIRNNSILVYTALTITI